MTGPDSPASAATDPERIGDRLLALTGQEREAAYRAMSSAEKQAAIKAGLSHVRAHEDAYAEHERQALTRMESERHDRASIARARRVAVADGRRLPMPGVWQRRPADRPDQAWRPADPAALDRRERHTIAAYRRRYAVACVRRHVASVMRPGSGRRPRARQRREGSTRNRSRGSGDPHEPEPGEEARRSEQQHLEPARPPAAMTFALLDAERRGEGRR